MTIALDVGSKTLILRADENDDTVDVFLGSLNDLRPDQTEIANEQDPWKDLIGHIFGWGWIMVNQQGYLDGVALSFDGITPQLMITAMASCLRICGARYGFPSRLLR